MGVPDMGIRDSSDIRIWARVRLLTAPRSWRGGDRHDPVLQQALTAALSILLIGIPVLSCGCGSRTLHHPTSMITTGPAESSPESITIESLHTRFALSLHDNFIMELTLEKSGRFDLDYEYVEIRTSFNAWVKELPRHRGRVSGTYRYSRDLLTLVPDEHDLRNRGLPLVYRPARWGPRVYLVEEDRLDSFCKNAVTGRLQRFPRLFLLRESDADTEGFGDPCFLRIISGSEKLSGWVR